MAPKIFLTGSTGYIGGDALHEIVQSHPEYDISCLVRDSDKGAQVASQYSKVRLVYGDLDDVELLENEARNADVVLNCANSDHEKGAKALIQGLSRHPQNHPGYLIHTSGVGTLMIDDIERKTFGQISSRVYNDWEGIEELLLLPDWAPHRNIDKLILAAGVEDESKIKTAIVCPPMIYGKARGPGNKRGHPLYDLSRCTLEKKTGIRVGEGKNHAPNVHVYDLSRCYLKLVEAAVEGSEKAIWGKEGYFFAENGEHVWGEISKIVASAAKKQGFIPSDEVIAISPKEAEELMHHGSLMWGANCRCKAVRARKVLGWTPKEPSMEAEIPEIIHSEAARIGLIQGHAAKVAT